MSVDTKSPRSKRSRHDSGGAHHSASPSGSAGAERVQRKQVKGYSLHIGLNRIDPEVYGNDGRLSGCHNDAHAMQKIASTNGFNSQLLLDNQATISNVKRFVSRAAAVMNAGDVFMLTYSGHGSSVFDTNNDEDDGRDETWCLYNGMLIDDEIDEMLCAFRAGCRVVIVSDSCHSGTVTRDIGGFGGFGAAPGCVPRQLPASQTVHYSVRHRDEFDRRLAAVRSAKGSASPAASVLLLAGCQDNQFSQDGPVNGAFTTALLQVYYRTRNGQPPNVTYKQFYKSILRKMPPTQSPNFLLTGARDPVFESMRPFSLVEAPTAAGARDSGGRVSYGPGAAGADRDNDDDDDDDDFDPVCPW